MKMNCMIQRLKPGWSGALTLAVALILMVSIPRAQAAAAAELLEQGIFTEETSGDLKSAIQIYQRIVEDPGADRGLAAQAQLRLGLCQLKLGNKPLAISALDRLTQQFPDKDKLVAVVGQQMPPVLDEIVRLVERNYFQEVDQGELLETAINAIIGKLDARGSVLRTNDLEFLSATETKQMHEQIEQSLAGVGLVLKAEGEAVVVQTPLPDSPALAGGLRAGDYIVTVDGTALSGSNRLQNAMSRLRGPVGTPVRVGIRREGIGSVREFALVRNTIRLPTVMGDRRKPDLTWELMLDEPRKIGYVRLTYFAKQSAQEMQAALEHLTARQMQGLILDLRNDPGGLLDAAIAVADLFLDAGKIVTIKGREGETTHIAKSEGTFTGFPVALLVNRKTASCAEIVAGSLQDNQRAVVIGERTFGQGIVRRLFELQNGVGTIKLPVAAFYRPSGKPMNRYPDAQDADDWGVTPDEGYEIVLSDEELKQLEADRGMRDTSNPDAALVAPFEDRQLLKAIEFILAQTGQ